MKASGIKSELESTASTVNSFLLSQLNGKPKELYLASNHYIKTGGKRLRPFMVIKSCEMLGGSIKRALPAAAAVELVHNFTLVHDDIMDNDEMRHGSPTVHKYFGLPLAIIGGDILFSKAFEILTSLGPRAGIPSESINDMTSRLATACSDICEGQAIDVGHASNSKFPGEVDYINMIQKKTAALFEVSCALGALSAPASTPQDIENLSSFGRNIGIAFQLVDDLIGVIGDPKLTGKAAGNDIREGKKTLPILLSLQKAKGDDKDRILKVFGSKNASQQEIEEAVRVISESGIERKVRDEAKKHMALALKAIKGYENSTYRDSLEFSAEFVVGRSL
ncbi:MAG TPA: polyprenyl synthetase family protein [Nitrososphaera sp.]|nr:polyprenyl synthetase family protein [Nitrososphaera sp.]